MKTIVISAVNIVEAGPLTILRDCLRYLSELAAGKDYKIIALVYRRELVDFPNIVYIETQWPKENWFNRLWYEYVVMNRISKKMQPIYLWFSLHDTSPRVQAERQAVYCHNAFSFYKWKWRELLFAPKIVLFALFTKYIYAFNLGANRYLVVQQDWFRNEMANRFNFPIADVIVAKPQQSFSSRREDLSYQFIDTDCYSFLFPASPNSHKNFECLCEAVKLLTQEQELPRFKVYITVKGDENAYSRWLLKKWGGRYEALLFTGFLSKEHLLKYYSTINCLVFPSKVESWGLPISEFAPYEKPMLLADMPYTKETAVGSKSTAFFDPESPDQLATYMKRLIKGDTSFLKPIPTAAINDPVVYTWDGLFDKLLNECHENTADR